MKIQRIRLRHFRSHRNTVLCLERVNFIRGLNRSGKSSIAMAVEMVLAGRCAVTDEGGKGFEQLIQEGAASATVVIECTTPQITTITLTLDRRAGRTLKVETNGHTLLGKHAQEWIAEHVGTPDVINATMNAWRFMELSDNDQASLLARVLLPAKLELEPQIAEWLAANHLAIVTKPTLFATIEATHKGIAAARTEVNRTLRDLKAVEEPEPVQADSAAIKKAMESVAAESTVINETLRDHAKIEALAARADQQKATIEQEMKTIEAVLPELRAKLVSKSERKALETAVERSEKYPAIHRKLTEERVALEGIRNQLRHDHDGICPTCQTWLTEDRRSTLYAPLRANEEQTLAAIAQLEKQLGHVNVDDDAVAKLTVDNAARQKVRLNETALHHLQEQLDALACRECPAGEKSKAEGLREHLAGLKLKLEGLTNELVAVAGLEARHTMYRTQTKARTQSERHLVELEKLLEYFGPRGIKARLVHERLDLFTDRVNAALDQWAYSLAFTIEPYRLQVTEIDEETGDIGPALHPNQLSASERYRLGIAFALAIADWTNLRFLIADGADILDKDDKWRLAQMLINSDLEQAVMTSTGLAPTFEADGTAFFTLHKVSGATATEVDAVTPVGALA